jgi:hypothetical protein
MFHEIPDLMLHGRPGFWGSLAGVCAPNFKNCFLVPKSVTRLSFPELKKHNWTEIKSKIFEKGDLKFPNFPQF